MTFSTLTEFAFNPLNAYLKKSPQFDTITLESPTHGAPIAIHTPSDFGQTDSRRRAAVRVTAGSCTQATDSFGPDAAEAPPPRRAPAALNLQRFLHSFNAKGEDFIAVTSLSFLSNWEHTFVMSVIAFCEGFADCR